MSVRFMDYYPLQNKQLIARLFLNLSRALTLIHIISNTTVTFLTNISVARTAGHVAPLAIAHYSSTSMSGRVSLIVIFVLVWFTAVPIEIKVTEPTIPLPAGITTIRQTHPVLIVALPENKEKQEAQGLDALLDKMEDNDHINWITQRSRCIFHSKNCLFRDTRFSKIRNTPNDHIMTLTT